jgi:lipid kinase YegS
MKNLELVLNGKSTANQYVRQAVYRLRAEGTNVNVHVTWEGGDAARIASGFSSSPDTVVVAGGGDGTVNEVLNGLLSLGECHCAMAILPLGTANDLATSAAIPLHDPYLAMRLAAETSPTVVDVGVMNDRYFLNVASGGFGAEVTSKTPEALKNVLGGSAYALEAMLMAMHSTAYPGKLITPHETHEGRVIMFAVGNGRQAGGGAQMTPHALIDDGLLDVMLVKAQEDSNFLYTLESLAKLRLNASESFQCLKTSQLRIEAEREMLVNLDGEPVRGRAFSFSSQAKALRLVLPLACPLVVSNIHS